MCVYYMRMYVFIWKIYLLLFAEWIYVGLLFSNLIIVYLFAMK